VTKIFNDKVHAAHFFNYSSIIQAHNWRSKTFQNLLVSFQLTIDVAKPFRTFQVSFKLIIDVAIPFKTFKNLSNIIQTQK